MQLEEATRRVVERVMELPASGARRLIALAGPPAGGKSTLAEVVADRLPDACVVPMDGFHLDNRLLSERGLRDRKGAPETFDVAGFRHLLLRLKQEDEVIYPLFDRNLDCAVAGAGRVPRETRTIVVEGNYLLLNAPGWRDLRVFWDVAVFLSVPLPVLRDRLMQRWRHHGFSEREAVHKTDENDLPNARLTADNLLEPDMLLEEAF